VGPPTYGGNMPCIKCKNGKYRIGSGPCVYTSLKKCQEALRAYYASKKPKKDKK